MSNDLLAGSDSCQLGLSLGESIGFSCCDSSAVGGLGGSSPSAPTMARRLNGGSARSRSSPKAISRLAKFSGEHLQKSSAWTTTLRTNALLRCLKCVRSLLLEAIEYIVGVAAHEVCAPAMVDDLSVVDPKHPPRGAVVLHAARRDLVLA